MCRYELNFADVEVFVDQFSLGCVLVLNTGAPTERKRHAIQDMHNLSREFGAYSAGANILAESQSDGNVIILNDTFIVKFGVMHSAKIVQRILHTPLAARTVIGETNRNVDKLGGRVLSSMLYACRHSDVREFQSILRVAEWKYTQSTDADLSFSLAAWVYNNIDMARYSDIRLLRTKYKATVAEHFVSDIVRALHWYVRDYAIVTFPHMAFFLIARMRFLRWLRRISF